MAKEPKPPTVKDRLDEIERVIAKDNLELNGHDPLGLVAPRNEDILVQQNESDDLRRAISDAAVRRFIQRLYDLGGLMDSDSDPNPTVLAHHAGRRSLALDIFNAIDRVDPAANWQMKREKLSNAKSQEKKQDADQG